jgi:DNA transformation protein and related proteins
MKTDAGTIEFLCEQLSGAGIIRPKKMFGEYGLYCNEIIFALVCDNKLFVKATDDIKKLMIHDGLKPYEGSGIGYWHVDEVLWDDKQALAKLVVAATKYPQKTSKVILKNKEI